VVLPVLPLVVTPVTFVYMDLGSIVHSGTSEFDRKEKLLSSGYFFGSRVKFKLHRCPGGPRLVLHGALTWLSDIQGTEIQE
jgi:hypothetical protein